MRCFVFMIALLAVWPAIFATAHSAELIMYEQRHCEYCDQWNEEVGVVYDKTPEGKLASLRRVDIHKKIPADIDHIASGRFTPTFVLVNEGIEIGRIRGYPGEAFFWGLLGQMLKKLPHSADDGS